jgi:hypothetical protein
MEMKNINKRRMLGAAISEYLPILGLIATILIGGVAQYGNEARKQSARMSSELAGIDAPLVASNGGHTPGHGGSGNTGGGQNNYTSPPASNNQGGTGSSDSPDSSQVVEPVDGAGQQIDPVTGQPVTDDVVSGDGNVIDENTNPNVGQNTASVLEQVARFIEGAANGLKSQVVGMIKMLLNPVETFNGLKELAIALVTEPEETLKVLLEVFKEDLEKLTSGDPYKIGEVIGENVSPATLLAIVNKLRKIDKIANSPRRQGAAKDVDTACSSFLAGTPVWTENGMVAIETLNVGDRVYARSDETFADEPQRISHLLRRDVTHYYELDTSYEVIRTTEEHPFWLQGKGWTPASQLKAGDVLARADGDIQIHRMRLVQGPASVYNFTVEKTHTYFVGPNKLWVHNANIVCDVKHAQFSAIRERIPEHLRADFENDFYDPKNTAFQEALLKDPNLTAAWEAIHKKKDLRLNSNTLNKVNDVLNNPKLKAAGLDVEALDKIVNAQIAAGKSAGNAAPGLDDLLENLLAAEKYADRPGFDKVLASLKNSGSGGAALMGANYTLKFLKKNGNNITDIVFEEKILDGTRIVDMKGKVNNVEILFEFKSVQSLPPKNFGEQFSKDLINAEKLENIKWVFDKTKISESALKAQKEALLRELEKSLNRLGQTEKSDLLRKYGADKALGNVSELLEIVSKNFDSVFGVD